jgi:hypothetical protein
LEKLNFAKLRWALTMGRAGCVRAGCVRVSVGADAAAAQISCCCWAL